MVEDRKKTYLRLITEMLCIGLGVFLLFSFGGLALDILLPFLIAFILAWIFNPLLTKFEKIFRIRRGVLSYVLVILFYAIIAVLLYSLSRVLLTQFVSMSKAFPSVFSEIQSAYNNIFRWIEDLLTHLPDKYAGVRAEIMSGISQAWDTVRAYAYRILSNTAHLASSVAFSVPHMIIFLTVLVLASCFITSSYPSIRDNIYKIIGRGGRDSVRLMGHSFSSAAFGYLRSQLIFAIVDMVIILIAFAVIGVPYPVPIALVLCFLDFIPFFGAGTVLVPWGIICLVLEMMKMGIQLLVLYAILYVIRRIFEPKVLGGSTGFSSLQMLFSMYAGMKLFGVTGLVLAPIIWITIVNFIRTGILDGFFSDILFVVRDIQHMTERTVPVPIRDVAAEPRRSFFDFLKKPETGGKDKTKTDTHSAGGQS